MEGSCLICRGSGYEKRQSVLCNDCKELNISGCWKCKAGFKIHQLETCRTCLGRGK